MVILQILIWSLVIAFPYLDKPPNAHNYLFNFHLKHWVGYFLLIVVFNLNYFYFIPILFQKKKFISYFILVVLSFIVVVGVDTLIFEFFFPKRDSIKFKFHFLSSINLVVVFAISTAFRALQDWFVHKKEKQNLFIEKQKAEMVFLRSQISPHFLFNTLNNLIELMRKDVDVAENFALKFSNILRLIIKNEQVEKISLLKELDIIRDYVYIQEYRLNKKNLLNFNIKGDAKDFKIEPFVLINFVENVFKHGLSDTETELLIEIKVEDTFLVLHTANTVNTNHVTDFSNGIGLDNIKKRLDIVYKDNYTLVIKTDNFMYEVLLKINLL